MSWTLILAFGAGCSRQGADVGVHVDTNRVVRISEMGADDVLMRVNGVAITKRDFVARRSVLDKAYRLNQGLSPYGSNAKALGYVVANEQRLVNELLRRELMRQEAVRIGVVPTADQRTRANAAFLKSIRREGSTVEAVAAELNDRDGQALLRFLESDASDLAVREHFATNDLNAVTADYIRSEQARVKAFNEEADRRNAEQRAKALAVRKEILNGGSFADAAKKYAQVHPEHGKEWGDFEVVDFPGNAEMESWLKSAKPGDISEPIDLEDGLAIIGLVGKYKGDVPEGVEPPDVCRLVRCTFYAFENMTPPTDAEIERLTLERRRQAVQKEICDRLFRAAVIEMPNGDRFFETEDRKKERTGEGK